MSNEELKIERTCGFTLIELLIAVAISSIILVVLFAIVNKIFVRSSGNWEAFKAHNSAQAATHKMAKEIRQATLLVAAGTQSITFREYVDSDDTVPSQVRFYLDGTTMRRGEIPPTGTGPNYTYDPDDETTDILSFEVVNDADRVFSYYDRDGVELPPPVNPAELTLVKMELTFRQLNNPSPFKVETSAQLRFNKNNL